MECKKARELILTDYLDGQMDDTQRVRLKVHFANCSGCEEFALAAKKVVIDSMVSLERTPVPESLWPSIKEAIAAAEQPKVGLVVRCREKVKVIFAIPTPVFTFAAAVLFISIIGIAAQVKINNRATSQEQAEYSMNSLSAGFAAPANGGADFGTSIEEYFL